MYPKVFHTALTSHGRIHPCHPSPSKKTLSPTLVMCFCKILIDFFILPLLPDKNDPSLPVIGRQRRASDDREGQRPVDANRHGVARHQVRRPLSARRLHEDHVLQAVAADHHGRSMTTAAAAADGDRPPVELGLIGQNVCVRIRH